MTKYEYRIKKIDVRNFNLGEIDEFGEEGWELIYGMSNAPFSQSEHILFFKRVKSK